jgi:hypothetical protein
MADLSAYSNASFNSQEWINNVLNDRPEEEALESFLASLAMKLHILSQDYTDQLETGMVEAMTTMPRVTTEVNRIEDILKNVESEMQSLALQLKMFDQRNVSGVEDLSRLDTLKSNMEKCKATLEEHARWSQLVREAKNFLEGGGRLSESADRIETMYKSLDILQNMPGHEERKATCEALSNSLLSTLRPRVRRDISGLDLSPLHEYLYAYDKLGRKHELEDEYVHVRLDKLKNNWDSYDFTFSKDQFVQWFEMFFDKVAGLISDESGNAELLFGKERSQEVLSALLEQTLSPLSQPLSKRLNFTKSTVSCTEAYLILDEHSRKIMSLLEGASTQRLPKVLYAIYGGFVDYLDVYGEAEGDDVRRELSSFLELVSISKVSSSYNDDNNVEKGGIDDELFGDSNQEDFSETLNLYSNRLVDAADSVYIPVSNALTRAVTLMGGLRVKPVFRSTASALSSYTKQLNSKVNELRIACGLTSDINENNSEDMKNFNENWSQRLEENELAGNTVLIPAVLRALQAAGRLSIRLREIDSLSIELLSTLSVSLFRDVSLDRSVANAINSNNIRIGSAFANYTLQNDPNMSSELRIFLSTSSHSHNAIFSSVTPHLNKLKTSAGTLLFDLCINIPKKVLSELSTEGIWQDDSISYSKTPISHNLLPQPAITHVGEHMLSLVQELESFSSSDALPDLLSLIGEAQILALNSPGWRQLKQNIDIRDVKIIIISIIII